MRTSDGTDDLALLLRPRRPRARWRVGMGAAVVLVLAAAVIAVLLAGAQASGRSRVLPVASSAGSAPPSTAATTGPPTLYVHVAGEVVAPGLYLMKEGARVADALAAAGGLTEAAESDAVNLARRIVDGEQLIVPEAGAAPAPGSVPGAAAGSGPISLSTATAAQLEELPEVGPATAAKIIAYREANGPFASVDQLLEVPGIGEKTLEGFRDQVTP